MGRKLTKDERLQLRLEAIYEGDHKQRLAGHLARHGGRLLAHRYQGGAAGEDVPGGAGGRARGKSEWCTAAG